MSEKSIEKMLLTSRRGVANGCIDVLSIRKVLSYLLRLPIVEPTGHVVHFRERGLQSGLIGLIQHVEDMLTQVAAMRAELELYIEQGVWSLTQLGTLADDSREGGDWTDLDSLMSRLHPIVAFQSLLPLWAWNLEDFMFDWRCPRFNKRLCFEKLLYAISPTNWNHQTAYKFSSPLPPGVRVLDMGVSKNSGFSLQIIHFNRGFHYKPSILGYLYFWKHPYEGVVNSPKEPLCLDLKKLGCKSRGRTTPAGFIQGGWPCIPPSTLFS